MNGDKTPPLTQEEARGLAQRWAASPDARARRDGRTHVVWTGGPSGHETTPLDGLRTAERERLLAWVRERMAAESKRLWEVAFDDVDAAMTLAECDAWAADRTVLTRAVMRELGFGNGEHQTTYALCEAAGWPS